MCLAIPGQVMSVDGGEGFERRGIVDYSGVRQEVSLAYLPDVQPGDYVLVHVGYAMTKVDTAEAERLLREIRRMEEDGGLPPDSP
ncbi:MAG: HypC/HybG/HupF family hydrogenase formation chaperone [Verrucomicrobiota bacterium]|jgi:hydrogenase expression/formation protein HypC|nr:HypC/HybG/HupF family hydrogenase formation chaperone [Verrucomicrobiota bacterium]